MKGKKTYIIIILAVIFIGGAIFWSIKNSKQANAPVIGQENTGQANQSADITYFYRYDCSHCVELSKFLDDNKVASKVNFVKKEVHDQANANELVKRAGECNIAQNAIGVPFVYANGQCYIGTPEAEAFFKQEAGIQ